MAFQYQIAVPWGRSFDEYRHMFSLTDDDLDRSILGCTDGPANFNAEMSRTRRRVISCDPLYQLSAEQIKIRVDASYEDVISQTRRNQDKFVWNRIASPDELGRLRMRAMQDFLDDYEEGKEQGRYLAAQLPDLPFAPQTFDIALCSHFLFLYSDQFSLEFHQQAVEELCRVAREVRIFPLLDYNAEPSPFVVPVMEYVRQPYRSVNVEKVPYEFQRGGNSMLRISSGR